MLTCVTFCCCSELKPIFTRPTAGVFHRKNAVFIPKAVRFWRFPEGKGHRPHECLESVSIPEPGTKLRLSSLQIRVASNRAGVYGVPDGQGGVGGADKEKRVVPSSVGRHRLLKTWRRRRRGRRRRKLGLVSILLRELQPEVSLRLQLHPDLWGIGAKLETGRERKKIKITRMKTALACLLRSANRHGRGAGNNDAVCGNRNMPRPKGRAEKQQANIYIQIQQAETGRAERHLCAQQASSVSGTRYGGDSAPLLGFQQRWKTIRECCY